MDEEYNSGYITTTVDLKELPTELRHYSDTWITDEDLQTKTVPKNNYRGINISETLIAYMKGGMYESALEVRKLNRIQNHAARDGK